MGGTINLRDITYAWVGWMLAMTADVQAKKRIQPPGSNASVRKMN